MANVSFYNSKTSKLATAANKVAGAVYFTTDDHKIYLDGLCYSGGDSSSFTLSQIDKLLKYANDKIAEEDASKYSASITVTNYSMGSTPSITVTANCTKSGVTVQSITCSDVDGTMTSGTAKSAKNAVSTTGSHTFTATVTFSDGTTRNPSVAKSAYYNTYVGYTEVASADTAFSAPTNWTSVGSFDSLSGKEITFGPKSNKSYFVIAVPSGTTEGTLVNLKGLEGAINMIFVKISGTITINNVSGYTLYRLDAVQKENETHKIKF